MTETVRTAREAPDPFAITRADGRSNTQVILDLVRGADPGMVFTYEQIIAALAVGSEKAYTTQAAQAAVRSALPRLLLDQSRTLRNVQQVGYKVALAAEHQHLALDRKHKADRQMHMGMTMLQHVRLDELSESQRKAHMGTLMIVSALWQNQKALERRMDQNDAVLRPILEADARRQMKNGQS